MVRGWRVRGWRMRGGSMRGWRMRRVRMRGGRIKGGRLKKSWSVKGRRKVLRNRRRINRVQVVLLPDGVDVLVEGFGPRFGMIRLFGRANL